MSKKPSNLVLPPDVEGEYNGYLEFKIEEIKWRGNKSFNLLIAKVKFWGQGTKVGSIWFNFDGKKEPETLKYRIVTTSKLFRSYLKHSEPVQVKLVSTKTNNVIGSCSFVIPETVSELKPDTSGKIIGRGTSPIFSVKGFILGSVAWSTRVHLLNPLSINTPDEEIPVRDSMPTVRDPIEVPSDDARPRSDTFTLKRTSTRERDTLSDFLINNVPSISSTSETYTTVSSLNDYSDTQKQGIMNYLLGKNVPKEAENSILKEICNISPAASLLDVLSNENSSEKLLKINDTNVTPVNKSKILKDFDSIRFAVHGFLATKNGIKEIMKKFTSNNMTSFNVAIECQISTGPVKSTDNNTMYFLSRPLKQDDLIEKININKQNYRALNNPKQFFGLNNVNLTFVLWIRDCTSKISYILGAARVPLGQMLKENLSYSAKTAIKMVNSDVTVGVLSFHAELGCRKTIFGSVASGLGDNCEQDKGGNKSQEINKSTEQSQAPTREGSENIRESHFNNNESTIVCTKPGEGPKKDAEEIMSSLLYFGSVKDTQDTKDLEIYLSYFDLFTNEQIKTSFSCGNIFNFLKVFPVFINEEFLNKMKHNYILVEAFKYTTQVATIKLPLHQFYIAFRDNDIKSHLSKAKLPVISIDGWNNLISTDGNQIYGQLQVLLAVGTETQIETLKTTRGLATNAIPMVVENTPPAIQPPVLKSTQTSKMLSNFIESLAYKLPDVQKAPSLNGGGPQMRNTSDLLEMLQKALTERPTVENNVFTGAVPTPTPFNPPVTPTTNFTEKPAEETPGYIRVAVEIDCARKLPIIRLSKKNHSKRNKGKGSKQGGMDVEPSAYVTFEAVRGPVADEVKSHEGIVYSTHVIEQNCDPVWQKTFEVSIPADILWNMEKNFILKIWRKSNQSDTNPVPTPLQDAVIGFTAVNLRPFISGVPDISSWYNIIDFSGRTNGQIRVNVRLLSTIPGTNTFSNQSYTVPVRNLNDKNEVPIDRPLTIETDDNDFTNQLGRALKRKFTELEEISQRLKARLFDVTADDTENGDFDPDDEFERDLNTVVESDDEDLARDGADFAWLGDDKSMFTHITGDFCGTKDPTSDKKELDTALKLGDIETSVNLFKSILSSNNDTGPSTSQQGIGSLSQALKEASISDEKRTRKSDDNIDD